MAHVTARGHHPIDGIDLVVREVSHGISFQ
jgi:hypothetical protein